jgi:hypothetical protein
VSQMSPEVVRDALREDSTRAARAFVEAVRLRLQSEVGRHGEQVTQSRSYRRIQHSISPEVLRVIWPHADVDAALEE